MIVKGYLKKLILAVFVLGLFFVSPIKASDPMFSLYPAGGIVTNKEDGFTTDVLINSGGEKLISARFVITYDPTYVQVTKAEKNNSLFAQWPDDETSIDNTNGVVMLTGFSQSGTADPYITKGDSDIMARLTFKVIKSGKVSLDWAYSGENEDFKSVMLTDGSPPQNVLKTKPSAVTFTIGNKIVQTAAPWNKYVLVAGGVLILFGGLIMSSRPIGRGKKKGTIVVYEE